MDSKSGLGFVIRQNSQNLFEHQENLGNIATVFQAEVLAISRACEALKPRINQNIVFRSDSQSALLAIKSHETNSSLILECIKKLNKVGSKNKLTLQWIKAHVGHDGNELADKLAKAGATSITKGPEPFLPIPYSYPKTKTKLILTKQWNSRWKTLNSCRQTKLWFECSSDKLSKHLTKLCRFDLGRLVQFITGHCNLNRHVSLQDRSVNPACRHCLQSEETPWHLVTSCPSFISHRANIFHGRLFNTIEWSPTQLH